MPPTTRVLVIQTAFIGDAILATSLLETLHHAYPTAQLDLLVRKGNEGLFREHPYLHRVLIWDKKKEKYRGLVRLLRKIRSSRYDLLLNAQRYASTGFLTAFSGAAQTVGYRQNPFSFAFTSRVAHRMEEGVHEIHRLHALLPTSLAALPLHPPRLYPTPADYTRIAVYQQQPYVCIAPASVWFTKQVPLQKWAELIRQLPTQYTVYLLGGPGDAPLAEALQAEVGESFPLVSLCGALDFLASAALMQGAAMNYVNDSAPMHLCSAVEAPVCAVYCSTVPAFGFGPLSPRRHVVQTPQPLACRPCGLHGHSRCPEGHFACGTTLEVAELLGALGSGAATRS